MILDIILTSVFVVAVVYAYFFIKKIMPSELNS